MVAKACVKLLYSMSTPALAAIRFGLLALEVCFDSVKHEYAEVSSGERPLVSPAIWH